MAADKNVKYFSFADYDCIGFDLDNTLAEYKLTNLAVMVYELLNEYLVNTKGYDAKFIDQPLDEDFLQKGLIMDFTRGNVIRMCPDGYIFSCSHGSHMLTDEQVVAAYGTERKWEISTNYARDFLAAWNTPLENELRASLDYFDTAAVLAFAHCVDAQDDKNIPGSYHSAWEDVFAGLIDIFTREKFANSEGGYFDRLKTNPEKYIKKTSQDVIDWVKEIKKTKTVFLLTGSDVDFASFIAGNSLGENWKELFDVIVFHARKPGFFFAVRPFIGLRGSVETGPVLVRESSGPHVYSEGSWGELVGLLARITGKPSPKSVYVGDNLVQDIYAPVKFTACDVVTMAEEMSAEGMKGVPSDHPDSSALNSNIWGPFFRATRDGKSVPSLWSDAIRRCSQICIPSLKSIAGLQIDHKFNAFTEDDNCTAGFYPAEPLHAHASL